MKVLKAGIIGLSNGNGHPYSWSAICNGYNIIEMSKCPFPAIPKYLNSQKWPKDQLKGIHISHIWTQNPEISENIAKAAYIPNVVNKYSDLLNEIDILLLARDDAENHLEMSVPFLNSGIPVFIDKPLACSEADAIKMLENQVFDYQIFTCSALRYAKDILLNKSDLESTGKIRFIQAAAPKSWHTYAAHIIEPITVQFPGRGNLLSVKGFNQGCYRIVKVVWENLFAEIVLTGAIKTNVNFTYYGERAIVKKEFLHSFDCIKKTIAEFKKQIKLKKVLIDRGETLEIIKIIELGLK